jgi:hypothetical protein
MSKKKNTPKTVALVPAGSYIIKEARLKDDFCHYIFEITDGTGAGDTHAVKGNGIVLDDMIHAFGKLNVHLAAVDDVFKHSNLEIEDIDKMHTHDLTDLYRVNGIVIKGYKDNLSVILIGSKHVSSAGGRIELKSPKIALDSLSSYKWYNELNDAVEKVREEVRLYKEGKYEALETEDDENPKQLKITDNIEEEL